MNDGRRAPVVVLAVLAGLAVSHGSAVGMLRSGSARVETTNNEPFLVGDPFAEAIVERFRELDSVATLEIIASRKQVNVITGFRYTVLKARLGDKELTGVLNESTGAFALDRALPAQEARLVLDALPPVYRKMGWELLSSAREIQGGILGTGEGAAVPIDVTFYAGSEADLELIGAALSSSNYLKVDIPALLDKNPPAFRASRRELATLAAPEIRAVVAKLPMSEMLRVGSMEAVTRLDLTGRSSDRLDVSVPRIRGDVMKQYGLEGKLALIGIVDTGADDTHPDLDTVVGSVDLVVAEADFTAAARYCVGGANDGVICGCGPGGVCAANVCVGGNWAAQPCVQVNQCSVLCEGPEDDTHGHGTHVTGIAINTNPVLEGMAPAAEVISSKVLEGGLNSGLDATVKAGMVWARGAGADVLNLSLGRKPISPNGNDVVSIQADYESFVHNRLVIAAAAETPDDGPITPADGFNVIAVGATNLTNPKSTVATFQVAGPTADGRSKPDVSAPGESPGLDGIDSMAHNWEVPNASDFVDKEGTSMASPHVAGLAAALVGFGREFGILTDTPYLKAAILNNANRLAGWNRPSVSEPLDRSQGTGEIDALRTVEAFADDDRIWQQRVTGTAPSESHWYWLDVTGASPLAPKDVVITLVFERHVKDPGAAPMDLPDLNDLDLALYDPNGSLVAASTSSTGSVEHVVLPVTTSGRYCIEVNPFDLSVDGSELYALAAGTSSGNTLRDFRLNFMGTTNPCRPDYGDAPDPLTAPGSYPTLRVSNGARHLDWTKEWLGASRAETDGELKKGTLDVHSLVDPFPSASGEFDADDPGDEDGLPNLSDQDLYDDGVEIPGPFIPQVEKEISVTVQTTVDRTGVGPGGRYESTVPSKRLYLNGWADWNGDGDWSDPGEKILGSGSPTGTLAIDPETFGPNGRFTIGENFADFNASGRWEPGEPFDDTVGASQGTFLFAVTPPATVANNIRCRFRLDYGEDAGAVSNVSGNLAEVAGEAQFGEVEDYKPLGMSDCAQTGACCVPSQSCVETDQNCCDELLGSFVAGATCQTPGSCCGGDGSCTDSTMPCCAASGGLFQPGATCSSPGSCTKGGSCTTSSQECCMASGGTFSAGSTCPTCVPGLGIQAQGSALNISRPVRQVKLLPGRAKHATHGGALATAITASIDVNGVLNITGTTVDDRIEVRLKSGDPGSVEVEDRDSGDVFTFSVGNFVAMNVTAGDGDDLVVFNDAYGTVANLCPFSIDAGDGDDTILGATGANSVQDVLNYIAFLDTAQNIRTAADGILRLAGAVSGLGTFSNAFSGLGTGTDDVISKSFELVKSAESDLVLPGADIVEDVPVTLLKPMSGFVSETRDVVAADALQLTADAYNGLVLNAFCTAGGVCNTSATPASFNLSCQRVLEQETNALVSEAQALARDANSMAAQCEKTLTGSGRDAFEQGLNEGTEDLMAIAGDPTDVCFEETASLLNPDPNVFPAPCMPGCPGAGTVARSRRLQQQSANVEGEGVLKSVANSLLTTIPFQSCHYQLEQVIECMEADVRAFEKVGETCVNKAETTTAQADALSDLGPAADTLVLAGDALSGLGDGVASAADRFAARADDFAARAEGVLGAAGETLRLRGENELVGIGANFSSQKEAEFDTRINALAAQAHALVTQADSIIAQTIDQIEGQPTLRLALTSDCASITTQNTITGGPGLDVLFGSSKNDRIDAGSGLDLVVGLGGDDRLSGEDDWDIIFTGSGVNEAHGGAGIDLLVGGNEKDCLFGDEDIDVLLGRGGPDELDGGNDVDVIVGGAGDDVAHGGQGIDVMLGEADNDEMYGEECIDLLVGGDHDDRLYGGSGQKLSVAQVSLDMGDVIFGGSGADIEYGDDFSQQGAGVDVMFGGTEADHMFGANGGDFTAGGFTLKLGNAMFGGGGDDEIKSKDGIDVMFGGPGDDTMSAGSGYLIEFTSGVTLDMGDLMFGEAGNDTMDGDDPASPNGIDLMFGGSEDDTMRGYNGGKLTVDDFELTFGNLMFGGSGVDVMSSLDGIDLMFGDGGNDTMSAGNGSDLEIPGSSFKLQLGDLMFGLGGDDVMQGDSLTDSNTGVNDGIDLMFGGTENDHLYSGNGGDFDPTSTVSIDFGNLLFGGPGNDTLIAGYFDPNPMNVSAQKGIDLLFGGDGVDTLDGGNGGDIDIGTFPALFHVKFGNLMFGGIGDDDLRSGDGFDLMFGGPGSESAMSGGEGIDLEFGGAGDDHMDGGNGGLVIIPISGAPVPIPFGNLMFGNDGMDEMKSGGCKDLIVNPLCSLEIDLLFGNDCADTIWAGGGLLDLVFGNRGEDKLYGDQPNSGDSLDTSINLMFGNRQDDRIEGGVALFNLIFGNLGDDVIIGHDARLNLIFGNRGNDTIDGGGGPLDLLFGNSDDDIVRGGGGINVIFGNSGRDALSGGDGAVDLVFGNGENDAIFGGGGAVDVLFGNGGDDAIFGGSGFDLIFANSGDDIVFGDAGTDIVFGNSGRDLLSGGSEFDVLFGNDQDDTIIGGGGVTLAFGNDGSDVLFGNSDVDVLFGNAGSDWLYGGGSLDVLFGNADGDTLFGDTGVDFVFGNGGNDSISGGDETDILFGNADDDAIVGGKGRDFSFGNRGNDKLDGNLGASDDGSRDFSFGNRDNDDLYRCGTEDWLFGGFGSDTKHPGCSNLSFSNSASASISGVKMTDQDCNGSGDVGLAGVTIFLDSDLDGILDPGEPRTTTDESGAYRFTSLAAGDYLVREVVPCGFTRTSPPGAYPPINLEFDSAKIVDFVNCDLCRPDTTGSSCLPCPIDGQVVPRLAMLCSDDGSPCTEDEDCACGATCGSKVIECDGICVPCSEDPDIDKDGVPNLSDNCPTLYNPSQTVDSAGDTRGHFCNDDVDRDNDGVAEAIDNCPNEGGLLDSGVLAPPLSSTYNPSQLDTDGDGVGDQCDPCSTDPNLCAGQPLPGAAADSLMVSLDRPSALATIMWSDVPPAGTHYNAYVGTIPVRMMGSRPIPYDHACLESADSGGNGVTISADAATPSAGTARYYLVSAENPCGEGPLGTASNGTPRPNTNPCPTPP